MQCLKSSYLNRRTLLIDHKSSSSPLADIKDYLVTVFSADSLRCPDFGESVIAENRLFSASCHVDKAGFDITDWPQDFFVLFKGDQVVEVEATDENGTLTITNVQV